MVTGSLQRARILLIGSGRMGQIRASILYANPRFDFCGVVDVNVDGAKAIAEKYSADAFSTLHEAVAHFGVRSKSNDNIKKATDVPDVDTSSLSSQSSSSHSEKPIDGIVLCAPTFVHDSVIREAAANGLAIFTEKPVDETSDKISDLFDVCAKNNVSLCCGFQRRFDESYVAARNALKEEKIGKPVSASIFFADHPCPPIEFLLTGGNIFMDLSAHDIDYIRWALQDEVSSVYATGSSSMKELEDAGVHDNATIVMTFKKGTVVTLTMSRSACYGYDQRCEIFGTAGLIKVENEPTNTSILSDKDGVHQSRLKHSFPQRFHSAFTAELDAFADCLLLDTPWPITAKDCINVQRVADAARESCEHNKVVEL